MVVTLSSLTHFYSDRGVWSGRSGCPPPTLLGLWLASGNSQVILAEILSSALEGKGGAISSYLREYSPLFLLRVPFLRSKHATARARKPNLSPWEPTAWGIIMTFVFLCSVHGQLPV